MIQIRNDSKEIIQRNYDSLFLRFLIYTILSSFILFYLLYLRINDPTPLSLWNKAVYCVVPIIVLLIIIAILYMHIGSLQGDNDIVLNSINIKALEGKEFQKNIEWKNGSGLEFNKLTAYIKFQNYRFFIHPLKGDENIPDRVQIKTTTKKTTDKNYWHLDAQNYSITLYQSDWDNLSHKEIVTRFTELAERLRKNKVPPEY